MRKVLAILFAALFILGLSVTTLGENFPIPTAQGGVLIDMTGGSPDYTVMVGLGVGDLDLDFGFSQTALTFFPSVHKGFFFGGLRMTSKLPVSSSHRMSLALPVGMYAEGPVGAIKIGYSYPLVGYLNEGFFLEFMLRVDVFDLVSSVST